MPIFFPLPRTRKGLIIVIAIGTALFLAITVFSYLDWAEDQRMLRERGKLDFSTLSAGQLEDGLIVQGTVDMAFDVYAEEYQTNMGIRTSSKSSGLYYVIPVYDVDEDGFYTVRYFMTYFADAARFEVMERIFEQTWGDAPAYVSVRIENAEISRLSGRIEGFFTEWLEEGEFYDRGTLVDWCVEYDVFATGDREIIKSKMMPYMISETPAEGSSIVLVYILGGFAIAFLAFLIWVILDKRPIKGFDEDPSARMLPRGRD